MKMPTWTTPALWAFAGGGVGMAILGFSFLGWHSDRSAREMSASAARSAVVSAMVPFCVAKARADADPARMAKLVRETSAYSRSELVSSSGWATLPGMTSSDYTLATACSEQLVATAASL